MGWLVFLVNEVGAAPYLIDLAPCGILHLLRFFDAREFVGGNVILTMIRELWDEPPERVGADKYGLNDAYGRQDGGNCSDCALLERMRFYRSRR